VAVYVALLRGINVGGKGKVPMADLRALVEGCGFEDVATYIQSGNVVCTAPGRRSADAVAGQLEEALAERYPFAPQVVVRTRRQLEAIVAGNPFIERGEDEAVQHVTCFPSSVKPTLEVDLDRYAPEEAIARGHELYLHLPGGMGTSKLAADLARKHKANGTTRNWRTMQKLVELAAERA
jgi:uncharacterized protein (DUF1697 family)